MQRNRTSFLLALICTLALSGFVGCDHATDTDAPSDISSRTQTINLDDPFGGYNTADEKPAFDDPYLLENFSATDENLVFAAAETDLRDTDPRRLHRFLMVTWGNLRADSTIDFSTDWSGSLCVENGVVRAVRTIQFERGDHLLARTSRMCAEWVSHTRPRFDGVLVSLERSPCDSLASIRANADTLCGDPLTVTFKTGPLTVSFTQKELEDLHKVIPVDDVGNAVAFNTVLLKPGDCPHGFLAGEWKDVKNERYKGIFRGQWVSDNGLHKGFLRGVYGATSRGDNVFFGKWIAADGKFQGLLKGRYGRNPRPTVSDTNADGWFEGEWFSRQLTVGGELKGVWGEGEKEGEGGFFRGAWRAHCRR